MIKAFKIKKEYRNDSVSTLALKDISLEIKEGEFVAIIGPSGSGKSTLLHIMSFLDRPTSGVYEFYGKTIDGLSDDELAQVRNLEMGFIFQSFNLLPRTTVKDNIKLPLIYTKISEKEKEERIEKAIESVGLSDRIRHFTNQLSGGEQQRVAIARALVNNPKVIFADEPTGNLDTNTSLQIIKIFQKLNDIGHTIVLITHNLDISLAAKRIISLKDGMVVKEELIKQSRLI